MVLRDLSYYKASLSSFLQLILGSLDIERDHFRLGIKITFVHLIFIVLELAYGLSMVMFVYVEV